MHDVHGVLHHFEARIWCWFNSIVVCFFDWTLICVHFVGHWEFCSVLSIFQFYPLNLVFVHSKVRWELWLRHSFKNNANCFYVKIIHFLLLNRLMRERELLSFQFFFAEPNKWNSLLYCLLVQSAQIMELIICVFFSFAIRMEYWWKKMKGKSGKNGNICEFFFSSKEKSCGNNYCQTNYWLWV